MKSSEMFCLKSNDFETMISSAFREIRDEEDLLDCTLSCGPQQIQAHKLILSACSPFFRTVFKQNPHSHPLLYLKGISFTDLQAVITFMYHGEVNVAQEDLNTFLLVAEELKVKGLTQGQEQEQRLSQKPRLPSKTSSSVKTPALVPAPVQRLQIQGDEEEVQEIQEIEEVKEVKTEPGVSGGVMEQLHAAPEVQLHGVPEVVAGAFEEGYEYGDYGEEGGFVMDAAEQDKDPGPLVEQFRDSSVYPPVEKFRCQPCGKSFSDRSNCRRHVKSAHFSEQQVACSMCGRFYKNKRSVQSHCRIAHPEMFFDQPP